jgi:hypothetical protein
MEDIKTAIGNIEVEQMMQKIDEETERRVQQITQNEDMPPFVPEELEKLRAEIRQKVKIEMIGE